MAGRARALPQGSAQRALARIGGCRLTGAKDIARNIRTGPRRSGGLSEYVGVVIALLPTGRARTHTRSIYYKKNREGWKQASAQSLGDLGG